MLKRLGVNVFEGEKVELPWEVKLLRAMDFPTMKLHKRHTYGDLSNVPLTSAWGVEGSQRNNRGNSESSLRPRSSYQVCNGRAYTSPKQFHTAGAMRSKKQKQLRQKD